MSDFVPTRYIFPAIFPLQDFSGSFSYLICFRLCSHAKKFPAIFSLQEFSRLFSYSKKFRTQTSSVLSPKHGCSGDGRWESGAGACRGFLPGGNKLVLLEIQALGNQALGFHDIQPASPPRGDDEANQEVIKGFSTIRWR